MKQITSAQDIQQLGTILTVWAHPDDETYLAGGIMATAVRNGQDVICITATRGEAGSQNKAKWPLDTLADTRTQELRRALGELGVNKHHWLDYADGGCCDVAENTACRCLADFIERYEPDTILTFGPDGLTGHKDHVTVSRWVDTSIADTSIKPDVYHVVVTNPHYQKYLKAVDEKINLFFNTDSPPLVDQAACTIHFGLPPEIADLKRHCLAVMPSQTEKLIQHFDAQFIDEAFGLECYVKA